MTRKRVFHPGNEKCNDVTLDLVIAAEILCVVLHDEPPVRTKFDVVCAFLFGVIPSQNFCQLIAGQGRRLIWRPTQNGRSPKERNCLIPQTLLAHAHYDGSNRPLSFASCISFTLDHESIAPVWKRSHDNSVAWFAVCRFRADGYLHYSEFLNVNVLQCNSAGSDHRLRHVFHPPNLSDCEITI